MNTIHRPRILAKGHWAIFVDDGRYDIVRPELFKGWQITYPDGSRAEATAKTLAAAVDLVNRNIAAVTMARRIGGIADRTIAVVEGYRLHRSKEGSEAFIRVCDDPDVRPVVRIRLRDADAPAAAGLTEDEAIRLMASLRDIRQAQQHVDASAVPS
jgi:hypothetical protein